MNESSSSNLEGPFEGPFEKYHDWLLIVGGLFGGVTASGLFGLAAIQLVESMRGEDVASAELRSHLGITLAGQLGLWVGLFIAAFLKARRNRSSVVTWFQLTFKPQDFFWVFLGPILQVAIGIAYSPFTSIDELGESARELASRANGQVPAFVALSLAVSIGAPFIEELFFRGLVLGAVRSPSGISTTGLGMTGLRQPRTVIGIAISSLIFGIIHFNGLLTPALVFFGIIAGCLTVCYGRLGPSVWLHIGFNASTMLTMAFQTWN